MLALIKLKLLLRDQKENEQVHTTLREDIHNTAPRYGAPSRSTPHNSPEFGLLEAQQLSSYLHNVLGQRVLPGNA